MSFKLRNFIRKSTACVMAALILFTVPVFKTALADEADFMTFDFEGGAKHGFWAMGDNTKLEISSEEAHSGKNSLLTTGREITWHGAWINMGSYIKSGAEFEASVWVRLKTESPAGIHLTAKCNPTGWGDAVYHGYEAKTISRDDGWVEFKGSFVFDRSKHDISSVVFYIDSDNPNDEYYIDDFTFTDNSPKALKDSRRLPSLSDAYKRHFKVGSFFNSNNVNDTLLPLLKRHFNILTSEYDMHPTNLTRGFDTADALINQVKGLKIDVIGHSLLHTASYIHASWLTNSGDGKPLGRSAAIKNLKEYINKVAGHYAGQVYSWIVLNDAIHDIQEDTPWLEALRADGEWGSPWYQAFAKGADKSKGESGADYIEMAFRLAREADPDAKLYYNDYSLHNPHKAKAVAAMVKEINDKYRAEGNKRLLIEGISLKDYYNLDIKIDAVEETFKLFAKLGVEISVAEFNVEIFKDDENKNGKKKPTEAQLKKQAEVYANLFIMYKKYSKNVGFVTIWGLDDGSSWNKQNYPQLFNADYTPKPAYFAVADPEGYLAGNFDTKKQRDEWIADNGK